MNFFRAFCLTALLSSLPLGVIAQKEPSFLGLAPGHGDLSYQAPQAGSYKLPVMGKAVDGRVLDSDGTPHSLHELYGDKIVLLSFIYATCDDINGCPLATQVLHRINSALKTAPDVSASLRLITLSFNPEHDTPKVMAEYGRSLNEAGADWRFLTTRSQEELQPILKGYRQSVEQERNERSQPTGKYSHLLRVYLVDRTRQIRNIYTISVLHPDLVMADIRTLLKAPAESSVAKTGQKLAEDRASLLRPGDYKSGYAAIDYQTHTASLEQRKGHAADLFALAARPQKGLPGIAAPKDNPLSHAKILLGRKLFYDRRLSLNNTFSCAMCHVPEQGFTSQEQTTAIGIEGRTVRRNAPTLYNVAYLKKLFHDGRESTLENQVWGPLLAHNEMANPSIGFVVEKLRNLPDYPGLFEAAFRRGPGMETIGQALASYERTLISGDSAFDRWFYGKKSDALTPNAQRGYALFAGKAGCSVCHTIEARTALFTDNQLHNTGIGYRKAMQQDSEKTRVLLAPGIAFDVGADQIRQVSELEPGDIGLYEITQNPADRWKYRTPSLRNVALTAPYMHDGELATLRDVVDFYNRGGAPNENLDPLIKPLGLSEEEVGSIVDFLGALTGSRVGALVSDAWAAPVGQ